MFSVSTQNALTADDGKHSICDDVPVPAATTLLSLRRFCSLHPASIKAAVKDGLVRLDDYAFRHRIKWDGLPVVVCTNQQGAMVTLLIGVPASGVTEPAEDGFILETMPNRPSVATRIQGRPYSVAGVVSRLSHISRPRTGSATNWWLIYLDDPRRLQDAMISTEMHVPTN